MTADLAAVYLKAADVIRTNGHYKGGFYGLPESGAGIQRSVAESPVCIAGAVSVAVTGWPVPPGVKEDEEESQPFLDAVQQLADITGIEGDLQLEPIGRIAAWNDADERTQDDVIAALENSAKAVA